MRTNVQSIAPSFPPVATPQIADTERQGTLHIGPTGRVHKGGKSALPDNEEFWKTVNAVEFTSRGVTRQEVYRAVAWHVALTEKRICFAAVETIAEKARLGTTATRAHLRALERDGYIETEGDRSKGRSTTCYRLTKMAKQQRTNPTLSDFNPTLSVAYKGIEKGTEKEVQQRTVGKPTETFKMAEKGRSRLRSSPHTAQQRMVAAIAVKLDLPELLTATGLEDFAGLENTEKQALIKRMLKAEARYDQRAERAISKANPPEKRGPRPDNFVSQEHEIEPSVVRHMRAVHSKLTDTPPMTPELRAEIEAVERGRGWHRVAGKWMKLY